MTTPDPTPPADPHLRWKFIRDVLVFQVKLILGNFQNFLLVPISLGAAALDLVFKGKTEGRLFYRVLELGRQTDEAIDVYSSIGGYHKTGGQDGEGNSMRKDFTVDSILTRIEGVIVREYEKGGTAASIKGAVDRAIDELQTRGEQGKGRLDDALQKAADKFRPR